MDAMVDAYVNDGCEVVYGVRSKRENQPPASLGLPYFREER